MVKENGIPPRNMLPVAPYELGAAGMPLFAAQMQRDRRVQRSLSHTRNNGLLIFSSVLIFTLRGKNTNHDYHDNRISAGLNVYWHLFVLEGS